MCHFGCEMLSVLLKDCSNNLRGNRSVFCIRGAREKLQKTWRKSSISRKGCKHTAGLCTFFMCTGNLLKDNHNGVGMNGKDTFCSVLTHAWGTIAALGVPRPLWFNPNGFLKAHKDQIYIDQRVTTGAASLNSWWVRNEGKLVKLGLFISNMENLSNICLLKAKCCLLSQKCFSLLIVCGRFSPACT